MGDPRALHRMQLTGGAAKRVDRRHGFAFERAHLRLARTDCLAIDVHSARAAEAGAAAEARAGQAEIVADIPEERHLRIAVVRVSLPVDSQFHHSCLMSCRPSGLPGGALSHVKCDGTLMKTHLKLIA